jgi:hypothetical protein
MRPSTATARRAVWRLERSSDTSLMAIASCLRPRVSTARISSGVSDTSRAFLSRPVRPTGL